MIAELALAKDRKYENRRRRVLDRLRRQQWEIESQCIRAADRLGGRIVDVPAAMARRRFTIIQRISRVEAMRGPKSNNG